MDEMRTIIVANAETLRVVVGKEARIPISAGEWPSNYDAEDEFLHSSLFRCDTS